MWNRTATEMQRSLSQPCGLFLAWLCLPFLLLVSCTNLAASAPSFVAAKPIWPKGRETEKNLFVGFRATFKAPAQDKVFLRATGATLYRVFLNGHFLAHGPARGPHGFFRVDEWDLTDKLQPGVNVVAFQVAGYNVNSYSLLDQPSFLQAEVVAGGKVLASTDGKGAPSPQAILKERVQKVQRYSFQRRSQRCIGSPQVTTTGAATPLRCSLRPRFRAAGQGAAAPPRRLS
jgi:hypothetical protein